MVLTLSRQTDCQSTPCYFTLGLAGTTKAPQIHATVTSNGNCAPDRLVQNKIPPAKSNGTSRFSVTVPWSLLPPLRPLLYETIAVNLTFVRQPGRQFFQLITDPILTARPRSCLASFPSGLVSGRQPARWPSPI